jgi:ribonuclease-3
VLGQAVTVRLFTANPTLDEGALAKRRASVVSTVALAHVARGIGLGEYVMLGRGEEQTGGRDKDSILADTMEAVIGATYLSLGADAATGLVLRLIDPLLADPERYGAAVDPKTTLQELASQTGATPPVYDVTSTGPDHSRVFTATVTVSDFSAEGTGSSKKQAEMAAALLAWRELSARA